MNILKGGKNFLQFGDLSIELKPLKAKDMIDKEFVVVGSPATVRDKLADMAKRLNVGHLMVALQFGSMPHALAKKNIELFGREVLPHLQKIWEDKQWENPWWPKTLRQRAGHASAKWRRPERIFNELPDAARDRRREQIHQSMSSDVKHGHSQYQNDPDPPLRFRSQGEDRRQRSAARLSARGGRPDLGPLRRVA